MNTETKKPKTNPLDIAVKRQRETYPDITDRNTLIKVIAGDLINMHFQKEAIFTALSKEFFLSVIRIKQIYYNILTK